MAFIAVAIRTCFHRSEAMGKKAMGLKGGAGVQA
jgi:hypothetical protein